MDEEAGHDPKIVGSDEWTGIPLLPSTPEAFQEIQTELRQQTPRGVVVLAAAYLDWRVTKAIEFRVCQWELPPYGKQKKPQKAGARIFGSEDGPGELGFLDKCRMAYCLGLIGPAGFRDCERIAQIRNRFAHRMDVRTFSKDETVRKLCGELETPELVTKTIFEAAGHKRILPTGEVLHRFQFMETVQYLWIMLFQVTAYCPVKWPDPAGKVVYW